MEGAEDTLRLSRDATTPGVGETPVDVVFYICVIYIRKCYIHWSGRLWLIEPNSQFSACSLADLDPVTTSERKSRTRYRTSGTRASGTSTRCCGGFTARDSCRAGLKQLPESPIDTST